MTNQEISQLVFMLFAAFPQSEGKQTAERLRIYKECLGDLDFEQARVAIVRVIQTSKFLPTIAEVREAARVVAQGPRRTGLEAWGDAVAAIGTFGSYRSPVFRDPLVAKAVACLGWREVCLGENESALRARFIESYEAMQDREASEQAVSGPLRLVSGAGRPALPPGDENASTRLVGAARGKLGGEP